ncbi:MAG TPA: DUF3667 domain-containing protein [Puia sp.]|nr:DUF3667 domain-containing protein [Puia sp.]
MSHLKERKEKNCLNCQSTLYGRYCHVCGQENLEPKETVWHLVTHFFNDITHFDGKFFSTVKFLLKKPGFLSKEYMIGRRASYLNPIRMYVFTSAIFFIIMFSLRNGDHLVKVNETPEVKKGLSALVLDKTKLEKRLAREKDDDDKEALHEDLNRLNIEIATIKKLYGDTTTRTFSKGDRSLILLQAVNDSLAKSGVPLLVQKRITDAINARQNQDDDVGSFWGMNTHGYNSVQQYDSAEKTMPDSLRDGWLTRLARKRMILLKQEFGNDKQRYKEHFKENFIHSFPKILFISLPFFALILNMLYFRHKQYFYVDHGIFTVHLYCANFILILILILLNDLSDWINVGWIGVILGILGFAIGIYMLIYLYKAMRGFYGQGRGKTFLKYFITGCLALFINAILMLIFLIFSAISL